MQADRESKSGLAGLALVAVGETTLCDATAAVRSSRSCNSILMEKWSLVVGITLLQTGFAFGQLNT